MDGSFYQREEVDCSCFHFNSYHLPNYQHNHTRSNLTQVYNVKGRASVGSVRSGVAVVYGKTDVKTSLKRKLDESKISQIASFKSIQNQHTRNYSTMTDQKIPQFQRQKWIVVVTDDLIHSKKIEDKENNQTKQSPSSFAKKENAFMKFSTQSTKNNKFITAKPQACNRKTQLLEVVHESNISVPNTKSNRLDSTNSLHRLQNMSRKAKPFTTQNQITPSSSQNQSFTSISNKANEAPKAFLSIRRQDDVKMFKKISIRAQNNHIFFNQLQQIRELQELQEIYPKVIESECQHLSQNESEVIEKGTNSWVSQNQKKQKKINKIVSSLHIKNSIIRSYEPNTRASK